MTDTFRDQFQTKSRNSNCGLRVRKTVIFTHFWTTLKWSPGTVSVDWGVPKTAVSHVFRPVSDQVQEQYLWIARSRKSCFSHVFGPVWNEVQEQYLWRDPENSGFPRFLTSFKWRLGTVSVDWGGGGWKMLIFQPVSSEVQKYLWIECSGNWALITPALQSVV